MSNNSVPEAPGIAGTTPVDPARLIWGDAVVDYAAAHESVAWRNAAHADAWYHQKKDGDALDGRSCCIVGHLNFIAAELRGKDPIALRISSWPAPGEAVEHLMMVAPHTPDVIDLDGREVDTVDIVDWMITTHDRLLEGQRRKRDWYATIDTHDLLDGIRDATWGGDQDDEDDDWEEEDDDEVVDEDAYDVVDTVLAVPVGS